MDTSISSPLSGHNWKDRIFAYGRFLKIEHTLFSLPILFSGALLAGRQWPSWRLSGLILLAGISARTLALCLNRIIDRKIDQKNPRTATRELARGSLSIWDGLLVMIVSLLAYVWAAVEINHFCLIWSWVPVLFFFIYPTLKRFTWFSHVGLGLTWALAPMAGWFAVRPGFEGSWPALLLAIFSFFWLTGFDIIYATLDEEFDRQEGLYSLPARFGRKNALRISSVLHWGAFLSVVAIYATSLSGVGAAFLMIITGFLLFLEHIFVKNIKFSFFKINVIIGFVIFAMVIIGVRSEF